MAGTEKELQNSKYYLYITRQNSPIMYLGFVQGVMDSCSKEWQRWWPLHFFKASKEILAVLIWLPQRMNSSSVKHRRQMNIGISRSSLKTWHAAHEFLEQATSHSMLNKCCLITMTVLLGIYHKALSSKPYAIGSIILLTCRYVVAGV